MNEERATQAFELNSNGAPLALDQTSGFTYNVSWIHKVQNLLVLGIRD